MTSDSFTDTIELYLAGELPFEAAARALSRHQDAHFVQVRRHRDSDPDVRARGEQVRALMTRVFEINANEQLVDRRAEAPRINDWPAPQNPTDFCFSLEVVLSGRDQQQSYRESFRLYVCTPAWIARQVRALGPRWVTAPLVLPHWDPRLVHRALDELVHAASDDRWWQFVARMSRVFESEG
jgi:Immunity protein 8